MTPTEPPEGAQVRGEPADAGNAIGSSQAADWLLEPSAHAVRLGPNAGALKRILEGETVRTIMEQYEDADREAGISQVQYKRFGGWEIYLASAAAVFGALVLFLTDIGDSSDAALGQSPAIHIARVSLLISQVLCAGGAVAAKYLLGKGNPFIRWQARRTAAETARIELFETVCGMTDRMLPKDKTRR